MPSTMTPLSGSVDTIDAFIQGVSINTMSKLMSGMAPNIFAGSGFKKVLKGSGNHCVENNCFDDSMVTPTLKMIDPLINHYFF